MKVSELLEARRHNWRALEEFCQRLDRPVAGRRLAPAEVARFAALYRSTCADLALADAYQLPPNTVDYLHRLVGRAHNQLYRSSRFQPRRWLRALCAEVPAQLYYDPYLRLASVLFWGVFVLAMFLGSAASPYPGFAERAVGAEMLLDLEQRFEEPPTGRGFQEGSAGAAMYTVHNTTIGLRVFAGGLLLGIGGIYETVGNAYWIGAMFGHVTTIPQRDNFCQFVTAHGPFELTTIVLSAAVGMRLGFALVATGGLSRTQSIWLATKKAMPAMGTAVALFVLAALIEGFISPSSLPYAVKAAVGAASSGLLMAYFVLLGRRHAAPHAP
jgi:uncharacterized membrane protein SpoIIM required for sporulation